MTTAAERQSRRRTKLNQIAQDAGFTSWAKYETSIIQKGQNEMNAIDTKNKKKVYYYSYGCPVHNYGHTDQRCTCRVMAESELDKLGNGAHYYIRIEYE